MSESKPTMPTGEKPDSDSQRASAEPKGERAAQPEVKSDSPREEQNTNPPKPERMHQGTWWISWTYALVMFVLAAYLFWRGPVELLGPPSTDGDKAIQCVSLGSLVGSLALLFLFCWKRMRQPAWGAMIVAAVLLVDVNRVIRSPALHLGDQQEGSPECPAALSQERILGFETPASDWEVSPSTTATVRESTVVTGGARALALHLRTGRKVVLSSRQFDSLGRFERTVTLDLRVPAGAGSSEIRMGLVPEKRVNGKEWLDLGNQTVIGSDTSAYETIEFALDPNAANELEKNPQRVRIAITLTSASIPASGTPFLLDSLSAIGGRGRSLTTFGKEPLLAAQYATAVAEIRERLKQDQTLFALKFTLIGAVLLALYKLMGDRVVHKFEIAVARRRLTLFFIVPVLASAMVDASGRFNAKMMENLGAWVYCLEEGVSPGPGSVLWEHSLRHSKEGLFEPAFALMRSMPYSVTVLLFSVTVYVFLIMPRYVHDSSRLVWHTGCVALALFAVIGYSYRPPTEWAVYAAHCLLWCLVGCYCLRATYYAKKFLYSERQAPTRGEAIAPTSSWIPLQVREWCRSKTHHS